MNLSYVLEENQLNYIINITTDYYIILLIMSMSTLCCLCWASALQARVSNDTINSLIGNLLTDSDFYKTCYKIDSTEFHVAKLP